MSDSIGLVAAKQKLQWKIRKIDDEKFAKDLESAREKANAFADKDLIQILDYLSILYPLGVSPTSIVTFLGNKKRVLDELSETVGEVI